MSYDELRHFADSWGLLFMVLAWLGIAFWAFRPGAKNLHRDAANLIFDESPKDSQAESPNESRADD
jgi:cytochrome c oxidase cbb3-type subunit 4